MVNTRIRYKRKGVLATLACSHAPVMRRRLQERDRPSQIHGKEREIEELPVSLAQLKYTSPHYRKSFKRSP